MAFTVSHYLPALTGSAPQSELSRFQLLCKKIARAVRTLFIYLFDRPTYNFEKSLKQIGPKVEVWNQNAVEPLVKAELYKPPVESFSSFSDGLKEQLKACKSSEEVWALVDSAFKEIGDRAIKVKVVYGGQWITASYPLFDFLAEGVSQKDVDKLKFEELVDRRYIVVPKVEGTVKSILAEALPPLLVREFCDAINQGRSIEEAVGDLILQCSNGGIDRKKMGEMLKSGVSEPVIAVLREYGFIKEGEVSVSSRSGGEVYDPFSSESEYDTLEGIACPDSPVAETKELTISEQATTDVSRLVEIFHGAKEWKRAPELGLGTCATELYGIRDRMKDVHPLATIALIANNPTLLDKCEEIKNENPKLWDLFFGGLYEKIQERSQLGQIECYAESFAEQVGAKGLATVIVGNGTFSGEEHYRAWENFIFIIAISKQLK